MPPLPRAPAPIALACALLSTACAPVPLPAVVPPTLLACAPAPPIPDAPDDRAVAQLLLGFAEAHEDCAGRLARVREILTP